MTLTSGITHHFRTTRITSSRAEPVDEEAYWGNIGRTIISSYRFRRISSSTSGMEGYLYRIARWTPYASPNAACKRDCAAMLWRSKGDPSSVHSFRYICADLGARKGTMKRLTRTLRDSHGMSITLGSLRN